MIITILYIHVLCIYVHTRTFHILFRLFIYLHLAALFNVQFNLYANALFRKNKVSSKLSGVLSIEATVTQMQITLTRKKTWRIERAREREKISRKPNIHRNEKQKFLDFELLCVGPFYFRFPIALPSLALYRATIRLPSC